MKKLLSIVLAVLLATVSLFSLTASAAENRSVKFIKDVQKSKTLSVSVDTSSQTSGLVKDVTANIKLGDSVKIAGKGKVLGMNAKIYAEGKNIDAYIAIFKIRVNQIIDLDLDLSSIGASITPVLDNADQILEYLEYNEKLSSKNEDVFTANKDEAINMVIEAAKEKGLEVTADDLKDKSVAELCEIAGITDEAQIAYYTNLEKSAAHFYYNGDTLTGIKVEMADKDTGALKTIVDTSNLGGFKITAIGTNVPDSAFSQPKFAIDITGLAKSLVSLIMKNFVEGKFDI